MVKIKYYNGEIDEISDEKVIYIHIDMHGNIEDRAFIINDETLILASLGLPGFITMQNVIDFDERCLPSIYYGLGYICPDIKMTPLGVKDYDEKMSIKIKKGNDVKDITGKYFMSKVEYDLKKDDKIEKSCDERKSHWYFSELINKMIVDYKDEYDKFIKIINFNSCQSYHGKLEKYSICYNKISGDNTTVDCKYRLILYAINNNNTKDRIRLLLTISEIKDNGNIVYIVNSKDNEYFEDVDKYNYEYFSKIGGGSGLKNLGSNRISKIPIKINYNPEYNQIAYYTKGDVGDQEYYVVSIPEKDVLEFKAPRVCSIRRIDFPRLEELGERQIDTLMEGVIDISSPDIIPEIDDKIDSKIKEDIEARVEGTNDLLNKIVEIDDIRKACKIVIERNKVKPYDERIYTIPDEKDLGQMNFSKVKRTKEGLWQRVVSEVRRGKKGGMPGQWSARKAQLAVKKYREMGGGYLGRRSKRNSLVRWTSQKWRTKSGRPSIVGKNASGERYLPEKAIKKLSSKEYAETTRKKRRSIKRGKQYSKQPKKIAEKVSKMRR